VAARGTRATAAKHAADRNEPGAILMTATISNLLLALFLLAANAFYVAAEFALVKSRGFRINAMAEQNRFAARLLKNYREH
jgi:Cyclin M transmembrane N-terminal domain